MTNQPPHQPPVMPGYPTQPPRGDWAPQPPAPKRRGLLLWLIGATVIAFGAVGALVFSLTGNDAKPAASATTTAPLPQDKCGGGICNTEPVAEATTPRVTYTPTAADFTLRAKVTEKHCFGSAGCNVTFEPDVTYNGALDLDPGITWQVVYEIDGVDDAPQVGNLTVEGTQVRYDPQDVSTKSSKSKITLKVTSVDQQQ